MCSLHFEGRNGPKPSRRIPTLFPSKSAPELFKKRSLPNRNINTPMAPRARLTFDSGVQCSKQTEYNAFVFDHCSMITYQERFFKPDSGDIVRDTTRDTAWVALRTEVNSKLIYS